MPTRKPDGDDSHDPDDYEDGRFSKFADGLRRRRRALLLGGLALVVVLVALGAWLSVNAFDAKSSLEQARQDAQKAKEALLQGKTDEALQFADAAQSHAKQASDATHSVPWSIAAAVPWLGSPFDTGRQISDVVLGLAADVLQPAARVGLAIAPDQLFSNGRVDVRTLRDEESQLTEISGAAIRLNADAASIPDPRYVSVLGEARSQLQEQTSEVAGILENTALAARLAPAMMGADGPRTYFMGFQTNAEARGTGGLLGGFGILRFNDGTPTVDTLASNRELIGSYAPIDLGAEYAKMYGYTNPTTDFRNSNLSSHFPYAAQIWKAMWEKDTGITVDGAIVLDPVALSYMLGAVGSITLPDGEEVTKDNVVELTESTAYARYPDDQIARKKYLQDIAGEVVKKMTGKIESPRALLDALGRAVSERRIAIWSANPAEQELLEQTPLAHTIPEDAAPYAEIVINNLGGNKLDYYLRREIEYVADGCDGDTRMSTVTVRLKNDLPADPNIPDYILGTAGLLPEIPLNLPRGTMVTSVRLLATNGAKLESSLANGERAPVISGTERGHPSFEVQVIIPPGQSGELTFRLSEPTSPGEARVPVQPLVDTVTPVVSVPKCAG